MTDLRAIPPAVERESYDAPPNVIVPSRSITAEATARNWVG